MVIAFAMISSFLIGFLVGALLVTSGVNKVIEQSKKDKDEIEFWKENAKANRRIKRD